MTDTTIDFDALRAERNRLALENLRKLADELGCEFGDMQHNFNPHACYCACPNGPCEHRWDGEGYESDEGRVWSATCSRCGMTAMSHDQRVMP